MGGQGIDRREALRYLALASVAARYPGFCRWAFGGSSSFPPGSHQEQSSEYQPRFFRPDEYQLIDVLTDLIIPGDDSPGARESGVSEFVDFMVASDPNIQVRFRDGLRWLETHSLRLHSRTFLELTREEQNDILRHLSYREQFRPREEEGRAFFSLIREYTVMGFYTSRIGMEELDSPHLQSMYTEPPECPHVDDREHQNLRSLLEQEE